MSRDLEAWMRVQVDLACERFGNSVHFCSRRSAYPCPPDTLPTAQQQKRQRSASPERANKRPKSALPTRSSLPPTAVPAASQPRKGRKRRSWDPPPPTEYALNRPKRTRIAPLKYWLGEYQSTKVLKDGSLEVTVQNDKERSKPAPVSAPAAPAAPNHLAHLVTSLDELDWERVGSLCIAWTSPKSGYLDMDPSGRKPVAEALREMKFVVMEGIVEVAYHSPTTGKPLRKYKLDPMAWCCIPAGALYSLRNRAYTRRAQLLFH